MHQSPLQETIVVTQHPGWLNIHLQRPEKKNALTMPMYEQLYQTLVAAEQNEAIVAVCLTAAGDVFCSGHDLSLFVDPEQLDEHSPVVRFLHKLATFTLPLVAVVQGPAVGIGATVLLHCDAVHATENSYLHFPFIDMGLVPEAGATLLMPQLLGHNRAKQLLLLGQSIQASRAEQWGLITSCLDETTDLGVWTEQWMQQLVSKSRAALIATKGLLNPHPEQTQQQITHELSVFFKLLLEPSTQQIIQQRLK